MAIGAFGAHALHDALVKAGRLDTFETAVRYQFFHVLALLAIGVLWAARPELRSLGTTGWLWLGGIVVFGLNGFVIGPVIAAMFMAVWDLFATAREEAAAEEGASTEG